MQRARLRFKVNGTVVAVHATTNHPQSSYGRAVWVDDNGCAYCEVDLSPTLMQTLPFEVIADPLEFKVVIGNKVKTAREAKGWSRDRLAKEITRLTGKDVRTRQISNIEEARTAYTIDYLLNVFHALEIEPKL